MQNETAPDDGLLPCPFCGHEPYTTSDLETMKVAGKRTGHEFAVMCSWCEITAPGAARVDDAVTYWNRRAHTAQPAAVLAGAIPIASAPTDGTEVVVYVAARDGLPAFITKCAYHPDAGWCADELREVTHYFPHIYLPPAASVPEGWRLTQALTDVEAERRRQVEMAGAAACYALYRSRIAPAAVMAGDSIEAGGPWASEWRKPTSRRRDLVKTGALILAEIELLDRAAAPQPEEPK